MTSIEELANDLPDRVLVTDPDIIDTYRRDEAHLAEPGTPIGVLMASTTNDVATAVRWAQANDVPVVARGGGTGLAGGATAIDGCLVVCLARMNRIRELAAEDQLVVAEAGVITADVDRAAAEVGLMYPPDPSSHELCTIGGNVATNAGGLRCVKYGATRDAVLGLEVVLADGSIVHTGRRTVKGVAGYDLTSLLVGSEGTLGIITAVTFKLRPRPPVEPTTIVGSFSSLRSAAEAVAAIAHAGLAPSLMELIDHPTLRAINEWKQMGLDDDTTAVLVAQADGAEAQECSKHMQRHFEDAGAEFVAVSSSRAEADQLLEIRRLTYPATERLGHCLVEDVGVPRSKLPALLERIEQIATEHNVVIMTVAHAGDGNVHPTFVFHPGADGEVPEPVWAAADEVFRTALELGGTVTGEHGVGTLKRRWLGLELGDRVMELHRTIKTALDPTGILNPGKGF